DSHGSSHTQEKKNVPPKEDVLCGVRSGAQSPSPSPSPSPPPRLVVSDSSIDGATVRTRAFPAVESAATAPPRLSTLYTPPMSAVADAVKVWPFAAFVGVVPKEVS